MNRKSLFILILSTLVIGWQLLRVGYFPMHDDLQVMRLYQMRRCLNDGQLPCRWSPDMGNNYGQPMFNYYSVFPYYLGMIPNLLGVSYVDTVKILFLISIFLSGLFVYLLAKKFISEWGSIIAAIAYMVAPYHALDIFVRGAMSESWGLTLIPLVLYAILKVIKDPKPVNSILLSISIAALATTHNITTIITAPFLGSLAVIFFALYGHSRKQIIYFIASLLLGLGLASFFLLPLVFEKSLIQTGALTADYFDYHAHFTSLNQLFRKTFWGYGPSKFGVDDDISFFVGGIHILGLLLAPLVTYYLLKTKQKEKSILVAAFFVFALGSLFMTHGKSVLLWEKLPLISFAQFPWRFLGLAALTTSLLVGFISEIILTKIGRPYLTYLILFLLIAFNFSYFRFEKYFPWINDQQKLSGELYNLQVRAAVLDYLPRSAKIDPKKKAPQTIDIKLGEVEVNYFDKRSNYFSTEVDVRSEKAIIDFPVMYFPNWTLYYNRLDKMPFRYDNDLGLITVDLSKGHHLIQAWLENTPVRTISNLISLFSALVIILWLVLTHEKTSKE